MYISTGWSVWVIYVLKYIRHWGLNFKFLSKRQHYYITENRIIQKRKKRCQLFEINANHFIIKQYKHYNNISPDCVIGIFQ